MIINNKVQQAFTVSFKYADVSKVTFSDKLRFRKWLNQTILFLVEFYRYMKAKIEFLVSMRSLVVYSKSFRLITFIP